MTRSDAEQIAHLLNTTLVALEDHPQMQKGVRAAAIMIANVMAGHGRINADVFVRLCGFDDPAATYLAFKAAEELAREEALYLKKHPKPIPPLHTPAPPMVHWDRTADNVAWTI